MFRIRVNDKKRSELELTLSVFGKLPVYKDFIRHRCFGKGEVGAFARWIEEGFDYAGRRNGPDRLGGPRRVLFHAEKAKGLIVAVVQDSADMNGQRRFPFACYTSVPFKSLPALLSDRVLALEPLWRRLEDVVRSLASAPSLEVLGERIKGSDLEVQVAEPSATNNDVRLIDTARALFSGDSVDKFRRLTLAIRSALSVFRGGKIPTAVRPAIRLPLAEGIDHFAQSAAWIGLAENNVPDVFGEGKPVSIVLPSSSVGGDLWIVPRFPEARDFAVICREEDDSHLSFDPNEGAEEGAEDAGRVEVVAQLESRLSDDAYPLRRLSDLRLFTSSDDSEPTVRPAEAAARGRRRVIAAVSPDRAR